ncbi:hypothetical protein MBLNU459_g6947t1 [Dothideomycetes sp. NU459]
MSTFLQWSLEKIAGTGATAKAKQFGYDRRLQEHRWALERSAHKWERDEERRKNERHPARPFTVERDHHHDIMATDFTNDDNIEPPVFIKYDHLLKLSKEELVKMAKHNTRVTAPLLKADPEPADYAASQCGITDSSDVYDYSANKKSMLNKGAETHNEAKHSGNDHSAERSSIKNGSAKDPDTENDNILDSSPANGNAQNDSAEHDNAQGTSTKTGCAQENSTENKNENRHSGGRPAENVPFPPLVWPGEKTCHADSGRVQRGFPVKQGYGEKTASSDTSPFLSAQSGSSESTSKRADSAILPSSVEADVQAFPHLFENGPELPRFEIPLYSEGSPLFKKLQDWQQNRKESSLSFALHQYNGTGLRSRYPLRPVRNNYQDLLAFARRQPQPGYQVVIDQKSNCDNAITTDSEDEDDGSSLISVVNDDWPITDASIEAVERESSYIEMARRPCRKSTDQDDLTRVEVKSMSRIDTPRPEPVQIHKEPARSHQEAAKKPADSGHQTPRPSTIPAYSRKQKPRPLLMRGFTSSEPELDSYNRRTEGWQWNYVANAYGHSISELPPPWITLKNITDPTNASDEK